MKNPQLNEWWKKPCDDDPQGPIRGGALAKTSEWLAAQPSYPTICWIINVHDSCPLESYPLTLTRVFCGPWEGTNFKGCVIIAHLLYYTEIGCTTVAITFKMVEMYLRIVVQNNLSFPDFFFQKFFLSHGGYTGVPCPKHFSLKKSHYHLRQIIVTSII